MKKSISLLLVIILAVSAVGTPVLAVSTEDFVVNVLSDIASDDTHLQVVEVDGFYYLFYDTPAFTITMTLNNVTKATTVYLMNHHTGILTYEVIDTFLFFGDSNVRDADFIVGVDITAIIEVSNTFFVDDFSFSNVLDTGIIAYEVCEDIRSIQAFGANDPRVIGALRNRGHTLQSPTFRASVSQDGITGRVYESTLFRDAINIAFFQIPAQLTVAAVSAKTGRPIATFVVVTRLINTVNGLVTAANSEFREFNVTVIYLRDGRVNGISMLTPARSLRYTVAVGDQPIGLASPPHWDSADWIFNDVIGIAREAIRLWRAMTGQ